MSVDQFFCSGNHHVFMSGNGNTSKIINSRQCKLFCEKNEVAISNSSDIHIEVTDSRIQLENGIDANLMGEEYVLHGEYFENLLLFGKRNKLTIQQIKTLLWSGSYGDCHLISNTGVSVFGLRNQTLGRENLDLLICGNDNVLYAKQNEHLKVRGHSNHVRAISTRHVTVDESENHVTVSECSRHSFRKAKPNANVPANRIVFHGILTGCNVFADILCPHGADTPIHELAVKPKVKARSDCAGDQKKKTTVMPHIQVEYVGEACVNKDSYNLGIFQFKIEGLSERLHRHSPVKITIVDHESCDHAVSPCGKMVSYSGIKDDVEQELVLVGNQITENMDGSLYVHLIEIQEVNGEKNEGESILEN